MEPRTACNIEDEVATMLNIGKSPLLTGWICCLYCTPKCSLPSWLPEHVPGSCGACYQPEHLGPFLLSCSPAPCLPVCTCTSIIASQVQHPQLSFAELHAVADGPMLQSKQIPFQDLSSLPGVNSTSPFSELAEDVLHSCIHH